MSTPDHAPSRSFPGSALLHPLGVGAVALLIVNDHLLKDHWPSWWTGKLSDLAGLAMFPLVLQGLWEQVGAWNEGSFRSSRTLLVGCVVLTGLCFTAIKVSALAGAGWQWGLGVLQWPFNLLHALLTHGRVPPLLPVAHTVDVTDLVTLPALLVSLKVGWRR